MHKLLIIVLSLYTFTARADAYFECVQAADPLTSKACASSTTVEKARRLNATYQQAFAESESYEEIKQAVKIKNDYRNEVAACRAVQEAFTPCIEAALDKATASLNSFYAYTTDPLSLNSATLKEAAHKNASLFKDEARKVPTQCMKEEAKKSDDNVSPASDIALNVARACKAKATEFVTFANDTLIVWDVLNLIPRMNYDQVNDLSERSFGTDAATKVVLETRVEKYKAASKAKAKKKKRKTTVKQK